MDGSGWEYLERYSEDYDKHIEKLNKQIECLQEQLDELQNENNNLCNDIVDLNLTIENKGKQLNEARDVIKLYAKTIIGHKQDDGTYAFHCVSGEIDWLNPLNSRTYMQTTVYDPRPAKKWLKKWGVK